MERYDKIEYDFDNSPKQLSTDEEGFITSQQYVREEATNTDKQTDEPKQESLEELPPKKKKMPSELLTVCQLVVCIIIALVAYVVKNMGGDIYENIRELYYSNLNNSIIIDMEKDTNDNAIKAILNDINSE